MRVRGPRTGTGVYLEDHAGRFYNRVKCRCGRDERVPARKVELQADSDVVTI
jgi:hypothetical protein